MRKVFKWGVIIFVGLIVLSTLVGDEEQNNNEASNASPAESNTEEQTDEEPLDISWEIYDVEDSSLPSAERFAYRVVIHEQVTPEEIKEVGNQVIHQAKKETPFNALYIYFYDYPEYADSSYVLARATMAPKGEWAEANSVETGDYDYMEVIWDIKEKNWDDRLTPEEVEVFGYWDKLRWKNPDVARDEINATVAEEFDLTPGEVDAIVRKQLNWVNQDLSE